MTILADLIASWFIVALICAGWLAAVVIVAPRLGRRLKEGTRP